MLGTVLTTFLLLEFNEWKSKVEKNSSIFYILSGRRTNCQNQKLMYLDCRQNYIFRSTSDKQNVKCITANNIGSTCPSSMV